MSPPAKRRKLDLSEEFKVIVGIKHTQKTFTVAKQFLTKSSDFFRKACNGDWNESQTKIIKLPEGTPENFSIYLQWLYTGDLVISELDVPSKADEGMSEEALENFAKEEYKGAIGMYMFADSVMDIQLQNSAMDLLSKVGRTSRSSPGVSEVIQAVEGTMAACPLRRYLVDSFCKNATPAWIQRYGDVLPPDFAVELLSAYAANRFSRAALTQPFKASRCHYHVHDDDNPKCE